MAGRGRSSSRDAAVPRDALARAASLSLSIPEAAPRPWVKRGGTRTSAPASLVGGRLDRAAPRHSGFVIQRERGSTPALGQE